MKSTSLITIAVTADVISHKSRIDSHMIFKPDGGVYHVTRHV